MSSTQLTWKRTAAAKTGTAIADLINDILSAVNAVSGNAAYKWQVASSQNASTPYYVVLKPKSGAAGRILLVVWTSGPAGNNSAILDGAPTTNTIYLSYFPAGNTDSPSNLTASSGTIMGSDVGCIKVGAVGSLATIYAASYVPAVWMSEESAWFVFQNPAATPMYLGGAGQIYVDGSDNAMNGVFANYNLDLTSFGATGTAWATTAQSAGSTAGGQTGARGPSNEILFRAYLVNGWAQPIADTPMIDASNSKVYFDPVAMIRQSKGFGITCKFRQLAFGPSIASALAIYNTASLTPAAQCWSAYTGGAANSPLWFLNFKV